MQRPASIRTRLLAAFLALALAASGALAYYFVNELEEYALRNLEARLDGQAILTAALMSALVEQSGAEGLHPGLTYELNETLQKVGDQATTRLAVLDIFGTALADSEGEWGATYADRPEVALALTGRAGKQVRDAPGGRVELAVARPVLDADGQVVGVVYTSATTFSFASLLRDYGWRLAALAVLFLIGILAVTELLARWLAKPLTDLEAGAVAVAEGDYSVRVDPWGPREAQSLATAFNTMSERIERFIAELREEERRKDRFVSDVSHELRTPLTSIRGAAETLLSGDVPEERQRRFLQTIVRESERLSRLANDLLVLQRVEGSRSELEYVPVDVTEPIRRAIHVLEPSLEEKGMRVELHGPSVTVLGDPDRLQQVVVNLLDNAVRVSEDGSRVKVVTSRDGDRARIDIVDQGPGIPEGAVGDIFERFYRTDESRDRASGGFGLGLSIVRAIVEAHNGQISATNEPGGGARFTVRIPLAK
ncbi:MAG: hypothetical protein Kow0056_07330 [Coriobacteriia bacterium]